MRLASLLLLVSVLALPLADFTERLRRGAIELAAEPPDPLRVEGWWDQARTLEEE